MMCNPITFIEVSTPFKTKAMEWRIPPCDVMIKSRGVHLWRMELDVDDDTFFRLKTLLSADELNHANRFRYEIDRRRFSARKGMHRLILGHYLGIEPKNIQFQFTERGKPLLIFSQKHLPICFSTSSSGNLGLLAVTYNRRLGIDIENIGRIIEYEEIATSFFSPSEAEEIRSLHGVEQENVFLVLWTAKEAYLKTVGAELFSSLYNIQIPLCKPLFPSIFKLKDPFAGGTIYPGLRFKLGQNCIATLILEVEK